MLCHFHDSFARNTYQEVSVRSYVSTFYLRNYWTHFGQVLNVGEKFVQRIYFVSYRNKMLAVVAQSIKRQATGWTTGVRFPPWSVIFSPSPGVQTGSGTHPASYPMDTRVKRPGREADYSPPSSAEVKNAWRYTFTPIRLHDAELG